MSPSFNSILGITFVQDDAIGHTPKPRRYCRPRGAQFRQETRECGAELARYIEVRSAHDHAGVVARISRKLEHALPAAVRASLKIRILQCGYRVVPLRELLADRRDRVHGAVKIVFEGAIVELSGGYDGPGRIILPREPGIGAPFRNVSIVSGPNRETLVQRRGARRVDDAAVGAATLEQELAVPDLSGRQCCGKMRRTMGLRPGNDRTSHETECRGAVTQCVSRYQPHAAGCLKCGFRRVNRATRSQSHSSRRNLLDRRQRARPVRCERASRANGEGCNSNDEG